MITRDKTGDGAWLTFSDIGWDSDYAHNSAFGTFIMVPNQSCTAQEPLACLSQLVGALLS